MEKKRVRKERNSQALNIHFISRIGVKNKRERDRFSQYSVVNTTDQYYFFFVLRRRRRGGMRRERVNKGRFVHGVGTVP